MEEPNLIDEATVLTSKLRRETLLEVLKVVDSIFDEQRAHLVKRSQQEQSTIGNLMIVVESDLKNTIKKMI